jgi:hypothetical protein
LDLRSVAERVRGATRYGKKEREWRCMGSRVQQPGQREKHARALSCPIDGWAVRIGPLTHSPAVSSPSKYYSFYTFDCIVTVRRAGRMCCLNRSDQVDVADI